MYKQAARHERLSDEKVTFNIDVWERGGAAIRKVLRLAR